MAEAVERAAGKHRKTGADGKRPLNARKYGETRACAQYFVLRIRAILIATKL